LLKYLLALNASCFGQKREKNWMKEIVKIKVYLGKVVFDSYFYISNYSFIFCNQKNELKTLIELKFQ
jgi:hypothetical protein